jgi:hypothetical protein
MKVSIDKVALPRDAYMLTLQSEGGATSESLALYKIAAKLDDEGIDFCFDYEKSILQVWLTAWETGFAADVIGMNANKVNEFNLKQVR